MFAKYIKKEVPDLNGTGRTQAYYKMELTSMNFDEFVSLCAREGHMEESSIDGAAPSGSRPHVGDYQQRHSKPKVLRASEYLGYDGLRVSKKEKEHPMRGAPNYYVSIYNQRSALFSIKYTSLLRSVCLKSKVLVCLLILTYSMPSISAKSSQYSSVMS